MTQVVLVGPSHAAPVPVSSCSSAYHASLIPPGITCFATVGMFSAVSNLRAGGTQDTALSDISNGVLYQADMGGDIYAFGP